MCSWCLSGSPLSPPAHSPDNSFLGFVSEQTAREEVESELDRKDNIAVVYGKQEYMWQVSHPGPVPVLTLS